MKKLYLLTGATGHLGTVLISKLRERNEKIRALVSPGKEKLLPEDVEVFTGNVKDIDSMRDFFNRDGYDSVTFIHCAGVITIATKEDPNVWETNVNGTKNVMELAFLNHIDRVIYVSTVHAIPLESPDGIIREISEFSKDNVKGQYARSKAEATRIVLEYAKRGLNASVVHPSGISGPGDIYHRNRVTRTIQSMAK